MPKRSKTESAKSKVESAVALGGLGASLGGPIGGGIGALTGLIIGDSRLVFPTDMVAIPAFEAYLLDGRASYMVYIRAGESLMPTGGNVQDMREPFDDKMFEGTALGSGEVEQEKKRKPTAYQKRYKKAFAKIAPKYKTTQGKWKKNGFRRAVSQAHLMAKRK